MVKTVLTEKLGIKYPIVQGGMHHVGFAQLAAAVSNAGGIGIITALTQPSPEALREEIRKCRSMTDKPFGVNLTLLPMLAPPNYGEYVKVICEEDGVKVVETAGRSPRKFVEAFKKAGLYVIHKCVSIKNAKSAERDGVDMISIDGFECGGHPGEQDIGNLVLAARAKEELKIPFIVSGGIANGYQLAAALALGAEGVNAGTLFMATKEAPIHENIKKALVEGSELDTTHVFRTLSNTERVYKNSTAIKVVEIEGEHPGDFSKISHLVKGDNYRRSFHETGNTDDSVWSCGLSMGLIHDIPSCAVLLERMDKECTESIRAMQSRL